MKKKLILSLYISFILLLCVVFLASSFFRVRPIIANPSNIKVIEILQISSSDGNTKTLLNYDESEIIDCLNEFNMKPTLEETDVFQTADYKLIITVREGNILKQIRLNNEKGYVSEGIDNPQYKLIDEQQLLNNLFEILDLSYESA